MAAQELVGDQVKNVGEETCLFTININPAAVTANLTCTFLDGQPYFYLVCCGSDLLSYPIKTLTNRGVVVGGTMYGLMANHVYYCKASAYVTPMAHQMPPTTVTFSFKTQSLQVNISLLLSMPIVIY